jgi:hypothetical protein
LLPSHQKVKWALSIQESHPSIQFFRRFGMILMILQLTEPLLIGMSELTDRIRRTMIHLRRSRSESKRVIVMLPNGGKFKASQSKQQQLSDAIINGMTKALDKDKTTPTCYQAKEIENHMKRAWVLPTKNCWLMF